MAPNPSSPSSTPSGGAARPWDVDFSLALSNRTGKYFIGRDVIAAGEASIGRVRYGRLVLPRVPSGLAAKLVARAAGAELRLRMRRPGLPGALRPGRRVLHLDPYTAALYRMAPEDMVLCHDMGPITHPDLFAPHVTDLYRVAYAEIVRARAAVVFVSRASRAAFHALYGDAPRDSAVIYPPLRADLTAAAAAATPPAGVTGRFVLTVGSIGTRKNQAASIRAFARAGLAAEGWRYVLCGSREPGAEEVVRLAEETEGVRLLSYVGDDELAWLYRNASAFVLASRLEGFGVPVAEAIATGLVPVVSRDSVLQEVAGPGAIDVDPSSDADIARGLRAAVALSEDERRSRGDALARSIRRFTPQAFAEAWRTMLADGTA